MGYEWAFTVHSFYEVWCKSGKMDQIGAGMHGYCMVRLDPIEAYGPHNCKIVPTGRLLRRNLEHNWHKLNNR
jgi:hypothetical protein